MEAAELPKTTGSFGFNTEKSGVQVTIKSLMDAGAHYGHQTQRWNPKMLPYIYGARNNVHIINLDITQRKWEIARKFVVDKMAMGGNILFVGTKQQAKEIVKAEATRCGAFFVASRWLGGTLSNFQTIRKSIDRMKRLESLLNEANTENSKVKLNKKEKLDITRELQKLDDNIGGIRTMRKTPDLIFIVDVVKESIAVAESNKLHIPVIGLVDTNSDPTNITFPIPSNDDASRAIKLFVSAIADAVIEGREIYRSRVGTNDPDLSGSEGKPGPTAEVSAAEESGAAAM